jgi:hypothetical protein
MIRTKLTNGKVITKETIPAEDLRQLRKEASTFFPHIVPVLYNIPLSTLLYHLPPGREAFFKKKLGL